MKGSAGRLRPLAGLGVPSGAQDPRFPPGPAPSPRSPTRRRRKRRGLRSPRAGAKEAAAMASERGGRAGEEWELLSDAARSVRRGPLSLSAEEEGEEAEVAQWPRRPRPRLPRGSLGASPVEGGEPERRMTPAASFPGGSGGDAPYPGTPGGGPGLSDVEGASEGPLHASRPDGSSAELWKKTIRGASALPGGTFHAAAGLKTRATRASPGMGDQQEIPRIIRKSTKHAGRRRGERPVDDGNSLPWQGPCVGVGGRVCESFQRC